MKKIILIILLLLIILSFFFIQKNLKKSSPINNLPNLSIALINGSGDKLAPILFSKYLQKYNFLVSYVIEIKDTFEKTVVVEHIDKNLKNGEIIKRCLGYSSKKPRKFLFGQIGKLIFFDRKIYPQVCLFLDSSLNISASIILGKDYFEIIKNGTD